MFHIDTLTDEYLEHLDNRASSMVSEHVIEYHDETYLVHYIHVFSQCEQQKVVIPVAVSTINEKGYTVEIIPPPSFIMEAAVKEIESESKMLCLS